MHVLIVEDDARIASFLDRGLRAEGYATTIAGDAREASSFLDTMPEEFHLVLLDLGLPDESGLEVLRQLRQRNGATPVIILTAGQRSRTRFAASISARTTTLRSRSRSRSSSPASEPPCGALSNRPRPSSS